MREKIEVRRREVETLWMEHPELGMSGLINETRGLWGELTGLKIRTSPKSRWSPKAHDYPD